LDFADIRLSSRGFCLVSSYLFSTEQKIKGQITKKDKYPGEK
jgi:hypothetical protein